VAERQGQRELARERLSKALARADSLGAQHLAVRIRLWLAPLLPASDSRQLLGAARAIAEQSGFQKLLDDVAQLERRLPSS
jgi:hypothetical protein